MVKLKRFSKVEKPRVSVKIMWKEVIPVEQIENNQLSAQQKKTAQVKDIIYIFVGAKGNGKEGVDVGQTSRSLEVRVKEHSDKEDYLETFPKDQVVYAGEVSCGRTIDRDLLEQIEGIIIHYLYEKTENSKQFILCNDVKRESHKETYIVEHIINNNLTGDLLDLLPYYIPDED